MGHRRNCRARHDSPWREHRRAQRRSTGRVLASHATPCPGGLALRTTRTAGSGRGWRVLITRTQRSGHQALTRRVPQPEPGCAARDRRVRVSCPEPTSGHPRTGASPTRRVNTWPSMSPGSHRFSRTTGTDRQQTAPRLPQDCYTRCPRCAVWARSARTDLTTARLPAVRHSPPRQGDGRARPVRRRHPRSLLLLRPAQRVVAGQQREHQRPAFASNSRRAPTSPSTTRLISMRLPGTSTGVLDQRSAG